jgi:CelD/BcsL family acetyltransferase involved in cellulose biosynthesis
MRVRARTGAMPVPLAAGLELEWRPLAALEPERRAWRRLAERAIEPNVFYDPDFALAGAPALGPRVQAALIWSRAPPRRLLGLFPVRSEFPYGPFWPVAGGWTHAFAPLGTPLVDRDAAEPVIDAFLTGLSGLRPAARILLLRLIPEQGRFAAALDRVVACRGNRMARLGVHRRALLDPGKTHADYLARTMSSKRRKNLNRLRRRLDIDGSLQLATARTEAEIASSLPEFLALEAKGWKGRRGTALSSDPAIRRFVDRAVRGLAAASLVRIDRLVLAGRTLAAAITLQYGDTAWFWKIAYDETQAQFSPGVQLTLDLTGSLLDDPRIERVDSCASQDHSLIDQVWGERLALCDRLIALDPRRDVVFQTACRLEALRRRGRAAAKRLRSLVRRT